MGSNMYELFWFKKGSYLDIRIMQEMAVESDLDGRWCVCFRYWHRSLNPRKLIEVKFSHLSRNMTMQRTLKLYKLPDVGFCAVAATSFFFFCLSDPTSLAQFLLLKICNMTWKRTRGSWGEGSLVGRVSDQKARHIMDVSLIPWCGKGFF